MERRCWTGKKHRNLHCLRLQSGCFCLRHSSWLGYLQGSGFSSVRARRYVAWYCSARRQSYRPSGRTTPVCTSRRWRRRRRRRACARGPPLKNLSVLTREARYSGKTSPRDGHPEYNNANNWPRLPLVAARTWRTHQSVREDETRWKKMEDAVIFLLFGFYIRSHYLLLTAAHNVVLYSCKVNMSVDFWSILFHISATT